MGDRACVLFFDLTTVSPAVYLHWHGRSVPAWLDDLAGLMAARRLDATYAAARFVGLCHARMPGNLSLGIASTPLTLADLRGGDRLSALSPGDAGVVVVDTADFAWRAYAGYLVNHAKPIERSET